MPGFRDLENHFENYEHLTHLPRADEALHTLRKCASLVKPIMRKRGWVVGTLCEFLPAEAGLLGLNINSGRKICLRLRYPGDPSQFLPYDNVVDTMVHELSHIVWGPHDENFNNLWNELRGEVQSLLAKGYTGEGFMGKGKAVGGRRMPVQEAQRLARKRAQEQYERTKNGPQKLGGRVTRPRPGEDMRKVIADAAERRTKINKGCPTEKKDIEKVEERYGRQGTRTKAEENDADNDDITNALIDLLMNDEERRLNGLPPLGTSVNHPIPVDNLRPTTNNTRRPPPVAQNRPTPVPQNRPTPQARPAPPPARRPAQPTPALAPPAQRLLDRNGRPLSRLVTEAENRRSATRTPPARTTPLPLPHPQTTPAAPAPANTANANGIWACPACTFHNSTHMPKCEVCDSPRPERAGGGAGGARGTRGGDGYVPVRQQGGDLGWVCHHCDTFMENQWWTCSNCGTFKLSS